ncbi:hypothetical protein [Desulfuromonas sp. TF]|uniref:hypothetical protein n=1 Tax=Desulfuromonas sp. TF TaxID=1232410 RepID=UPI00048A079D|nr:hypothetical protein [Desulfuromonas sp. TF]
MNIFRGVAIISTQVPLILFVGAKFDLIFGFNRMDSGFGLIVFLFVFIPLLNLFWFIIEVIRSFKFSRHQSRAAAFLMPFIAASFLIESIAIDLYIASHARM